MRSGWKLKASAAAALACILALSFAAPASAQRKEGVDLALVLAVDVSGSMDEEEQAIQRQGYADAFRSGAVQNAVRNAGSNGRIAVAFVEWSEEAATVVDWTIIGNSAQAKAFADNLSAEPINRGRRTSISTGLQSSIDLFDASPYFAARKVIDISGDGANNSGAPVEEARDAANAKNIIVNGLPIMLNPPRPNDAQDLEAYYRDCVKTGRGSFVLGVHSLQEMAGTIRNKLVTEISDAGPREGGFIPAQAVLAPPGSGKADCLVGERNRNRGGYGGFTPGFGGGGGGGGPNGGGVGPGN
jgi:Protein of unknown function (DUF1194)